MVVRIVLLGVVAAKVGRANKSARFADQEEQDDRNDESFRLRLLETTAM